jgi:RNA polymerase sigma factor for flagellar operon FliA
MNIAIENHHQQNTPTTKSQESTIRAYLPLVRRIAHRIARDLPDEVDINDLVSAGCIGLISALGRFDPDRGPSFGTFAEFRIRGAILDELRQLDPLPRRSRRQMQILSQTRRGLTNKLGHPPDDEDMANHLKMTINEYHMLTGRLIPTFELSLSLMDHIASIARMSESGPHATPDNILQRKELRNRLVKAIQSLPERSRTVISLYYYSRMNYKEIALLFDVTESRICQIHSIAVNQLRKQLESDRAITKAKRKER